MTVTELDKKFQLGLWLQYPEIKYKIAILISCTSKYYRLGKYQ